MECSAADVTTKDDTVHHCTLSKEEETQWALARGINAYRKINQESTLS